jgi:hypothetical protein
MAPTPRRSATSALTSPSRWRETSTLARSWARLMNGIKKCWPCHMAMMTGASQAKRS